MQKKKTSAYPRCVIQPKGIEIEKAKTGWFIYAKSLQYNYV